MRGCRNAIISPLLYSSIFGNHNIPPLRPSTTPIFRNCHCNSNYGYFSQKMADCFYSEVKPMGIKHEFSVCFFSGLNEEWQLPFQPKQLLPNLSPTIYETSSGFDEQKSSAALKIQTQWLKKWGKIMQTHTEFTCSIHSFVGVGWRNCFPWLQHDVLSKLERLYNQLYN